MTLLFKVLFYLNVFGPFQLPEEARELDKEVRQIVKEKEEAVRNQDFEKVMPII